MLGQESCCNPHNWKRHAASIFLFWRTKYTLFLTLSEAAIGTLKGAIYLKFDVDLFK